MTTTAWTILAIAACFSVTDWIAVGARFRSQRVEFVAKPVSTGLLILLALALEPTDPAARAWFVAALALCLAGDVFLMLPNEAFIPGLASFLLGHIAFIAGLSFSLSARRLAVAAPIVAVVAIALGARLIRGARERSRSELVVPLVAYVAVIGTMASFALATGNAWAGIGAVLFMTSDGINGWGRFVGTLPAEKPSIMVTYHLALVALVVSLTR